MAYKKLIYIFTCTLSVCAFAPETTFLEVCLQNMKKMGSGAVVQVYTHPASDPSDPSLPSMPAAAPKKPIPEKISNIDIQGVIGEGGFGTVYLGETAQGHKVAVKVIHNNRGVNPGVFRDAIFFEFISQGKARELEQKKYKTDYFLNITRREGEPATEGRMFFVSDFVPASKSSKLAAPSLHDVIEYSNGNTKSPESAAQCKEAMGGNGRLSYNQLQDVWSQVAQATAIMHEAGVVHADLKPENILLTRVGRNPDGSAKFQIKIIDFGISTPRQKMKNPLAENSAGSPLFMPLDQWNVSESNQSWDRHAMAVWYQTVVLGREINSEHTYPRNFGGRDIPQFKPLKLNRTKDGLDTPFPSRNLIEQSIYATVPIAETHQEWRDLHRTSSESDRRVFYGHVKRKFQEILKRPKTDDYHPEKEVARRVLSHEGLIEAQKKGYLLMSTTELFHLVRGVMMLRAESQRRRFQGELMHDEVSEELLFREFIDQVYRPLVKDKKIPGTPEEYFRGTHPEYDGLLEEFRVRS